jgi:hypothetical protein
MDMGQMRDITADLRQRLSCIRLERGKLHKRLRALEARQRNLEALLVDEENKFRADKQLSLFSEMADPRKTQPSALREFLIDTLSNRQEASLSDLMRQACQQGILESHASARALNMTLINLRRRGCIERLPSGLWRKTEIA